MATRFYLARNIAAPVETTPHAEWDETSDWYPNWSTLMSPTPTGSWSGLNTRTDTDTVSTGNLDILLAQFVSDRLDAQTISGTLKGQMRASESSTNANMRSQVIVRVVSADGLTVRGTLYGGDLTAGSGSPTSEWATTLTNRRFPSGSGGVALSSVDAQLGDRIVIEVGCRAHNTSSTTYTATLQFGYEDFNGFDLPEDETNTAGQGNPWFEFSDDIAFFTQAATDFSEYATGSQPSDWTEQWDNTSTPWSVETAPVGAISDKALRFSLASATNTRRALSWDTVGSISGDVEILTRWQRDSFSAANNSLHHTRLHIGGAAGTEDAYFAGHFENADDDSMSKYVAGTATTLAVDGSRPIPLDTWHWTRLQRTGTTIRQRTWEDGDPEPGTWDYSTTDSSLTSGYVGVGNFGNAQVVWWDYVAVGIGGAAAPLPIAEVFGTATLTSDADLDGAGFVTTAGAATLASNAALSASGLSVVPGTAALTADAAVTAAGLVYTLGTATLTADALLSAVGGVLATIYGAASLGSDALMSANGFPTVVGAASMTSDAAMAATGYVTIDGGATLSSDALMVAIAAVVVDGVASLTAAGLLTATGEVMVSGQAALTADAVMLASGEVWANVLGAASLTSDALLAASGDVLVFAAASLTADPLLVAAGDLSIIGSATLTSDALLSAAAIVIVGGTAVLSSDALLVASADILAGPRYRRPSNVEPEALVSIDIRTPYPELAPLGTILINPLTTAVSFDTDAGGFGRLRVGYIAARQGELVRAFLPEPVEAPDQAHVTVRYGGSTVYEGVLVRPLPGYTGFEALGYGQWAPRYGVIGQGGDAEITSGIVVAEAIAVTPWLVAGEIRDPGVRHVWSDVQDRKASDVISQMADEGGDIGSERVPWIFTVYEDRLARFVPMMPADLPELTLGYDAATMDIGWDYESRIDAVRIVYQDRTGTRRIAPERGWFTHAGVDSASLYLRREQLTASADSADVAAAVALTHLHRHSGVRVSGSLSFGGWQQLSLRYGDTASIEGYGANVLTQTQVDLFTGQTQATLGEPPRSTMQAFLQRVDRAAASAYANTDPVSLGIRRF